VSLPPRLGNILSPEIGLNFGPLNMVERILYGKGMESEYIAQECDIGIDRSFDIEPEPCSGGLECRWQSIGVGGDHAIGVENKGMQHGAILMYKAGRRNTL